jgi:hypothetical protein
MDLKNLRARGDECDLVFWYYDKRYFQMFYRVPIQKKEGMR